jgi:PIN domain nuclease of toxin-antitoxin system
MPDAVTDTHALIWYLQDDARLSAAASQVFDACETDGGRIAVPSISAVEIIYLAEKGRVPAGVVEAFLTELNSSGTILYLADLNLPVVLALAGIPRATIRDLPDRIIAATAVSLGLPLITRDGAIQASGVKTIW